MVFYNCPRCGFQTELRANMTRHLTRKFSCQVILENISISECFQTILNEENNSVNKNVNKNENSVNKNVNKNDNNVNNVNINVNIKNQQYKCNFCEKIFSYCHFYLHFYLRYFHFYLHFYLRYYFLHLISFENILRLIYFPILLGN